MIPPINGIQASAAATFEGKPVDGDVGLGSGPGAGPGGGGIGSWSGMIYIHRMQNGLSSNLAFQALFRFHFSSQAEYHALLTADIPMAKRIPSACNAGFHADRVARRNRQPSAYSQQSSFRHLIVTLDAAKAAKDLSNLRQIGALMQTYLNDKDQILPK